MKKKRILVDYILMILLLFISGNLLFSSNIYLIIVLLLSWGVFILRRKKIDSGFTLFIVAIIIVFAFQSVIFDFVPVITITGVLIRVFTVYFILKSLDIHFITTYLNSIYYLSIFSLIIFVLLNIIPHVHGLLINHSISLAGDYFENKSSIIIYTLFRDTGGFYRNSGPFWEPGAFGGYLMLGLIFNFIKTNSFFNKKTVIILIALVSTTSTTAYIALFFFLFFIAYRTKLKLIYKFLLLIIVVSASGYLYLNVDFLSQKVQSQLQSAEASSISSNTNSQRFLSTLRDIQDIRNHFFWGRGPNPKTRYNVSNSSDIRTNGFSDYWVRYGSVFFVLSLFYLYQSFKGICCYFDSKFAIFSLIIILIILQSETYFNYPLFWGLFFLNNVYSCQKKYDAKHIKPIVSF